MRALCGRRKLLLVGVVIVVVLATVVRTVQSQESQLPTFTYYEDGGRGPSNWATLDSLDDDNNQCGGTDGESGFGQSPVTVSAQIDARCDTNMAQYEFVAGDCTWTDLDFSITNNGVKAEPSPTSQCSLGRMKTPLSEGEEFFNAIELTIHTSSEHQIVGQGSDGFFPAEMHVIHRSSATSSSSSSTTAPFAMFATMIQVSNTDHPVFEWFLQGWEAAAQVVENSCPDVNMASTTVQRKVACTNPGQKVWFVNNDSDNQATTTPQPDFPPLSAPNVYEMTSNPDYGIFTYKGSFTTPTCFEGVHWNLLDTPMYISQSQIDRLEELVLCYVQPTISKTSEIVSECNHATIADREGSTARPVQPLQGRRIVHRCPRGPNVVMEDNAASPQVTKTFNKTTATTGASEPANTGTSKCDKIFWGDCDTDKRHNPKYSPNLRANAPLWNDLVGYWSGTATFTDANGKVLTESLSSVDFPNQLPYRRDDVMIFVNRTVIETRYYETIYYVYAAATEEFCTTTPVTNTSSATALDALGSGTCGFNGYVTYGQRFGTATFEKDGVAQIIGTNGRFAGVDQGYATPGHDTTQMTFSIDIAGSGIQIAETEIITNADKTQLSGSGQYVIYSNVAPYDKEPVAESYTYNLAQLSVDDFIQELQNAYELRNIPFSDRVPIISEGYCLESNHDENAEASCPTEADFAATDPKYAKSPYGEDAQILPGLIVLFFVLGVGAVFVFMYIYHVQQMNAQADRYRSQFAKRVAETIEFAGEHTGLTPEALQQEFRNMDSDEDGLLSYDELHYFMGTKMTERDFDAMFAALDIDATGSIEFAEFCAFLAEMGHAFNKANGRAGVH